MMQHKISAMCDKVSVMYEKSMTLRRLKYDKPKESRTPEENFRIDALVEDIQALAGDLYNDRSPYIKPTSRSSAG
jgi:hypothetical protein